MLLKKYKVDYKEAQQDNSRHHVYSALVEPLGRGRCRLGLLGVGDVFHNLTGVVIHPVDRPHFIDIPHAIGGIAVLIRVFFIARRDGPRKPR